MSNKENSPSGKGLSVVWLRRDLRLHDHAALAGAARQHQPVQPVFVFDTDILARFRNPDDRRLTLIARALCHMHAALQARQGGILVAFGKAVEILPRLCEALRAHNVIAAQDVEPDAIRRDSQVEQALKGKTGFLRVNDQVVHAAHEVLKEDGTPYKVFTPYARAWRALLATSGATTEHSTAGVEFASFAAARKVAEEAGVRLLDLAQGERAVLEAMGYRIAESEWLPQNARGRLEHFIDHSLYGYHQQRDRMDKDGTSRLSPYLRFGILSVRECARAALNAVAHASDGAATWMNELIWRDFYSMILAHFPDSVTQELQTQYRGLRWNYDEQLFATFVAGKTGYPIVDAGMRELLATGVMHNRARMIVASFLTKDLLIDWRWGEEHFAQYLMDYDLASNVGGWQWAASTGTDAQPYFRIFNPVLQSQKFDPEGEYIRRFVPELAHLPTRDIHEPWKKARPASYPPPVVDHALVKEKVLTLFKSSAA